MANNPYDEYKRRAIEILDHIKDDILSGDIVFVSYEIRESITSKKISFEMRHIIKMAVLNRDEAEEEVLSKLRELITRIEKGEIISMYIVPAINARTGENSVTIYYMEENNGC